MINLGIIGCGRIVEEAHIHALIELKKLFRVVALADPSSQQLEKIAAMLEKAKLPRPALYTDYRKMLKTEKSLTTVDMALPHHLHHEGVMAAAAAGLNVFTEKPLAVNLKQADAMIAAMKRAKRSLIIFHNYLYIPAIARALELVRDGAIGKVFLIRNEGLGGGHWPGTASYDPAWRTKSAKAGGGCLLDNGYHHLYLCREFMGAKASQVYAVTRTYTRPITVDDTAVLLLSYKNGGTACVQTAWSIQGGAGYIHEIQGTGGTISFSQINPATGQMAPLALYTPKTAKWTFPSLGKRHGNPFTGFLADWGAKLDQWLAKGMKGAPPTNAPDARRNLETIEMAYKSSKAGKAIKL
ncbi:MAG: Gfo/Idh/MocA family oxidoreductase [Candidatus Sumerlaeaceae bacterium]|nr:Gfo/Idh/MocA family oxidoreductase [Candidatus Sumerlaeaceae bacterium]